MALAYFITFTAYGTRLHGMDTQLGSVDRDHNAYRTPVLDADAGRMEREAAAMRQPPYRLDAPRQRAVRDAIVELAREKGWTLRAAHVRSSHVHVVVVEADRPPGRLMSDLKARASRNLTRAGLDDRDRLRWTRHGSTRHLFTPDQVEAKIHYVLHEQGQPMALYDGAREPRTK